MNKYVMLALAMMLAGCADDKRDYEAAASCQAKALQPGTAEYDQCVRDMRAERLLQQQQREFEQMKREERDWKMRRY
jgi:hypothetical protein